MVSAAFTGSVEALTVYNRTVPLNLLTIDSEGNIDLDNSDFLSEREQFFSLDTNKPFKLNAAATGFCENSMRLIRRYMLIILHRPRSLRF